MGKSHKRQPSITTFTPIFEEEEEQSSPVPVSAEAAKYKLTQAEIEKSVFKFFSTYKPINRSPSRLALKSTTPQMDSILELVSESATPNILCS